MTQWAMVPRAMDYSFKALDSKTIQLIEITIDLNTFGSQPSKLTKRTNRIKVFGSKLSKVTEITVKAKVFDSPPIFYNIIIIINKTLF